LIFSLIGLRVEAEVKTNPIKEKKYFEKYQGKEKKIYLFGVEFTDRNIGNWIVSKINQNP